MENLQPKLRFPEFKDSYNLLKLKDLTLTIGDGLHSTPKYNDLGNYHFINGNNLKDGLIVIDEKTKKVDEEEYLKHKRDIDNNTILLSINGTIGNLAYYNNENVILGKSACYINVFENKLSKKYLYYQLKTNRIIKYFENSLTGSTIKNLGLKSVSNTTIITPSIQEQTKIADFLGAVDKQLDILNQKKEKLNTYKKGVMQQLFAQQLRFKDDNGNNFPEWEEKTLGEVANSFNGLTGKTAKDFGEGKKYIQYKQIFDKPYIDTNDCGLVNIQDDEKQNQCKIGDVFFTVSSETKEEIAMSSVIENSINIPLYLNSFCFGVRFNDNVLIPKFSRFYFRNESFRKSVIVLAQGSTRFNLSKVNFMKLTITIPSLEEQTKIANFLSAIDNQIETIENQITKSETYKKGLLQQMFV